jgi:predicted nucleic acid-binding protein
MNVPPRIFVDTSFLVALYNQRDANHVRAESWQATISQRAVQLVTTEMVLWEFLNAVSDVAHRRIGSQLYRQFHADPSIQVIPVDRSLSDEAVRLYDSRPDKAWGIFDCLSFVVLRSHKLRDCLTADHHFEQAGFAALLLRDPPK